MCSRIASNMDVAKSMLSIIAKHVSNWLNFENNSSPQRADIAMEFANNPMMPIIIWIIHSIHHENDVPLDP